MHAALKARHRLHHALSHLHTPPAKPTAYQTRNYTPPTLRNITASELTSARSYCSSLLRTHDAPSYTLQTFVPSHARDAYLALRAFNIDVARIADATSNPTVGALRCQFWRDAVTSALAFAPPKESVAILLANAALTLHERTEGRSGLSKGWLHRIISTREKYLANPPYPDLAAVETYAENTYSTLLYLNLSALPLASVSADHVASHIGKAQGIVALLRGLPFLAFPPPPNHHSNQSGAAGGSFTPAQRQGTVTLPLDVMAKAGVRETDVLRDGPGAQGLRDAVFEVAVRASDHLITAREMFKNLSEGREAGHEFEHGDDAERPSPSPQHNPNPQTSRDTPQTTTTQAFPLYLPLISTQLWLDKLQSADFNPFEPRLRTTDWRLPVKAYWAYTRGRF
ncbi:MAG: hypothetical protein M1828_005435 [Chrysothrix sp. TS-e1954]|nr:MAG: hypothetical protein M1828_005435 [Chrysothrix sp. TS-e1954]